MTKEEMLQQINQIFGSLIILKPLNKQEMIDKINTTFDKLIIQL